MDRAPLGRAQWLDAGEAVDEEAVAQIGRDAAGARVRLGDVALVLERCHVISDGRGRDSEAVAFDECLRAHRFVGRDVVLDDGAEHGEASILEHRASLHSIGTHLMRVPVYDESGFLAPTVRLRFS
ncbi:unannotated protein [freshwater metagenome]|uniref:Unannotated protein n=1 Tax=freshwater metagenome TaxID=449393 RepID=A0A6J7QNH1_9ZZZZ